MKHDLLTCIGIRAREHVQGPHEPPLAAPGDGAVRETQKAGERPLWFRLACGTRSGPWVKDYHRTTERHTPQPPRVSLAELRGFLEVPLCELRLDLRIRDRCGAKQHEQRHSVERVPNPHRSPFAGGYRPEQGAIFHSK